MRTYGADTPLNAFSSEHEAERYVRGLTGFAGRCTVLVVMPANGYRTAAVGRFEIPRYSHVPVVFAGYHGADERTKRP